MKTKPTYTSAGYKSSPLGPIPEDWEVKRLGDFSRFFSGGTPKSGNPLFYNGDIPFIRSGEINKDKTELFLSQKGVDNSSAKLVEKGDILYALYGANSGQCSLSKIQGAINQAILCIRPKANKYYVMSVLQLNKEHYYNSFLQGGQGNLSGEIVSNYRLAIPPIKEQERICAVLQLWDTAIAKQTALIEKLTLRKRGLMQQLLTGKKRLKGFEGEWKEVRLGETGTAYGGLVNKNKEDFENGNAQFITYMNVFSNGKIDTDNLGQVRILPSEKQEQVQYGDIFFTVSSETPDEVGMASVLLNEVQNTYLNSFCFGYRLNDFKTIVPVYASYLFRGDDFRKKMYKIAQGSTRFNISKTEVLNMRITIPSTDEQNAIASVLVNADKEIELANKKLARLQEEKRGLMQVLLTGKKRVKK